MVHVSSYFLGRGLPLQAGFVHSVFSTSLNLMLDGSLVHVGGNDAPLSCLGLSFDACLAERVARGVRQGDEALFDGLGITIRGGGGTFFIDLSDARVVSTRIIPAPSGADASSLREVLGCAGIRDGLGIELDTRAIEALLALSSVAEGRDEEGMGTGDAITFLVGRGLGLTPSGDDLLAGFGTALWFRGAEAPFVRFLSEEVFARTNDIGAAYLRAMSMGHANQDYLDLMRAIALGETGSLERHVANILARGHTSGHDSLLGFSVGMGMLDVVLGKVRLPGGERPVGMVPVGAAS